MYYVWADIKYNYSANTATMKIQCTIAMGLIVCASCSLCKYSSFCILSTLTFFCTLCCFPKIFNLKYEHLHLFPRDKKKMCLMQKPKYVAGKRGSPGKQIEIKSAGRVKCTPPLSTPPPPWTPSSIHHLLSIFSTLFLFSPICSRQIFCSLLSLLVHCAICIAWIDISAWIFYHHHINSNSIHR